MERDDESHRDCNILSCAFGPSGFRARGPKARDIEAVTVNIINAKGQSVGTAILSESPQGVRIKLDFKNLPPGAHLMHIHEFAKCEPPDFMSAGAHFNPTGTSHAEHGPPGIPAGDIPIFVLTVAADGTAHSSVIARSVTLGTDSNSVFSNGGTSLVIHAMAVEVSASAPPGIACGVITRPQWFSVSIHSAFNFAWEKAPVVGQVVKCWQPSLRRIEFGCPENGWVGGLTTDNQHLAVG
jgi:superoxide dismutase, Cu-Zn family